MSGDNDTTEDSSGQRTVDIEHRETLNTISAYINGAVITGPTSEGFYNLIFYSDSITIDKEIAKFVKSEEKSLEVGTDVYELTTEYVEAAKYREDKAKFLMSKDTLISLSDLIRKL